MENTISYFTQIGVGGIFAIIVIRTVFDFLKARRENGSSGTTSYPAARNDSSGTTSYLAARNGFISRTEFDEHRKIVQYRDNCTEVQNTIRARFDGMIKLDEERAKAQEVNFKKIDSQFTEVKNMIEGLKLK